MPRTETPGRVEWIGCEAEMEMPLVSVVLPVFNAERHIASAIESILRQTFPDFELIVVDDCSTDGTLQIIDRYRRQDSRIRLIRNAQNLKLARTLNKGIKASRGKYIARMDADDISYPRRLQRQVGFMEANADVGILGGGMDIIDEKGKKIGKRDYYLEDKEIRRHIFKFSPFCHPAVMIRKSALKKAGLYKHEHNPVEDIDLYFRLGQHAKFANLPGRLLKYRVVAGSMTTGSLRKMELKTIAVRKNFFNHECYNASAMDKIYNYLHYLSAWTSFPPPKQKIWLFSKIRSFVGPSE